MNVIALLRELRAQGMPEGQAEVVATAIGAQSAHNAATKADITSAVVANRNDLDVTKRELEGSIAETRRELEGSIADLRRDMETGFAAVDARFAHMGTKLDLIVAKVEVANTALYDRLLKAAMFGTLGFVGVLVTALNLLLTGRIKLG